MDGIFLKDVSIKKAGEEVLSAITLTVAPGEAYALLGDDCVSKRLLLRLAAVKNREYNCHLDGGGAGELEGGEEPFGFMTVSEFLLYSLTLKIKGRKERKARAAKILELLEIRNLANVKIEKLKSLSLSLASLAAIMVESPKILVLNFDGLGYDKGSFVKLNKVIKNLKAENIAVLAALPPSLVGDSFDRAGILCGKMLAAEGSPDELAQKFDSNSFYLRAQTSLLKLKERLKEMRQTVEIKRENNRLTLVTAEPESASKAIIAALNEESVPLEKLLLKRPSLKGAVEKVVKLCEIC